MHKQMVLLRLVEGSEQGWRCMARDEFMRRVNLDEWNDKQLLVLPPAPRGNMN